MAITTNDAIVKLGTTKTLEANGASTANNAITQADDASYSIVDDGGMAPDAEFVLTVTFASAPLENSVIALYCRELDIDGTSDAEAPEASGHRPKLVGAFTLNNVTSLQAIKCLAFNVPTKADYYILNVGTGQTLDAGWTLKVTPRTIGPSA